MKKSKLMKKNSLQRENYYAIAFVAIMALLCIFPFWIALVNSFASEAGVNENGFALFPKEITLSSYEYMLNQKGFMLVRAFGVSFLVVALGTLYTMFVTTCYAYAVAQDRKTFRFANALSFFAWFTTIFTGGIIPWYILTTQYYHLYNNLVALFIPSGLSVFNMFVVRNSFRAVPRELIEAATIDGASNFQIFTRIAIPLAKVGMVTIGLFTALGYWNDFSLSLYLITRSELYPVQKMLYSMMCNISFLTAGGVDASVVGNVVLPNNTAKMVLTVLTVLPVVLVFPFAQRYFVKGITVGAVKG